MENLGILPVITVILLAGAAIGATATLPARARPAAFYAQLIMMVGIYVGFAIIRLDEAAIISRGDWTALLLESMSALVLAVIGLSVMSGRRVWLLGALILIHGGVDLLHLIADARHSPGWYAFLCLIYDALVGVAAIWLLSEWPDEN